MMVYATARLAYSTVAPCIFSDKSPYILRFHGKMRVWRRDRDSFPDRYNGNSQARQENYGMGMYYSWVIFIVRIFL